MLGPIEVVGADGTAIDTGTPRHREVLAALAVDVGRVVSTDSLLARVWAESARGATHANLQAIISRLRTRLREAATGLSIATVAPGYRLEVPAGAYDAVAFTDGVATARHAFASGDVAAARAAIAQALACWRGEAFADIAQPFAQAEAARLDGLRLTAEELAAEIDLAAGDDTAAVQRLQPLVAAHPLREPLRAQLMLAHYRGGRQADALAEYASLREVLVDELGVDPGPDLQLLHQRILQQDPTLVPEVAPLPPEPPQLRTPEPVRPAERLSMRVVRSGDAGEAPVVTAGDLPGELLGRDDDIAYLADLVAGDAPRLITLTGVGGVGKTRLAHAVAAAARPAFDDGAVAVPLAPLLDPGEVVPAIARAVGVEEGLDPFRELVAVLRPRRMLLVLDNLEHLLAAAPGIAALVAACPRLSVLVTSRTPLRVRGEAQYPVQPLALPYAATAAVPSGRPAAIGPRTSSASLSAGETAAIATSPAVQLFVERAAAVNPTFGLTPANAAAVATLCRRLGGIPLALELAAARSRLLSPAVMLERLDEVMAGPGARDLPARQRTMRATLEWSHGLLGPDEQDLFARLSVFVDGFGLAAAEEVGGEGGAVVPLLDALVEQSLVVAEPDAAGGPRFRMLEPVVQYAATRLSPEESRSARNAHLAFYLRLAEEVEPRFRGAGTVEALALCEREHANLVAAIEWALASDQADLGGRLGWAIWLFWWLRGNLREGRRLMEVVRREASSPLIQVWAAGVLGAMTFAQGDLRAARVWSEGAELGRRIGDSDAESHCVAGEGLIALAEEDLDLAVDRFRRAIELCEAAGLRRAWLWTLAHVWLGTVEVLRGHVDQAAELVDLALSAGRARGDRLAVYIALFTAAQVSVVSGDTDRARAQLEEGILLSRDTGDLANLAYFLEALAVADARDGRLDRVGWLVGAAAALRDGVGSNVYGYYRPDPVMLAEAQQVAREARPSAYDLEVAQGRALGVEEMIRLATSREPQAAGK